ncbi:DNA-binding transcriptional regulator, FrmR family [Natronincola peptidivorans]|uniref:DNA-binding transcriptional regulator, FrmR family n=1 Tax=Natronincola peptidivorans TaxID=426128 RepID=A0A1I0D7G1_9FIRM|nr:metal-sensitive transcriptional regulator [Natronincola peptidivorans]SET28154.1 DNA-binding transcriptional regulator, FrmR family [Natronincola peptidivorans]
MQQEQIRKDILNRLKTVKGHIQGIEKMVSEDKSCEDILLQIAAVKSSIEKVGALIVEEHAKDCLLKDNITPEEVNNILKTVIKFAK